VFWFPLLTNVLCGYGIFFSRQMLVENSLLVHSVTSTVDLSCFRQRDIFAGNESWTGCIYSQWHLVSSRLTCKFVVPQFFAASEIAYVAKVKPWNERKLVAELGHQVIKLFNHWIVFLLHVYHLKILVTHFEICVCYKRVVFPASAVTLVLDYYDHMG